MCAFFIEIEKNERLLISLIINSSLFDFKVISYIARMKIIFNVNILFFLILSGALYSQEAVEKNYTTFGEFLKEQNTKIDSINNGLSLIEVRDIMGPPILVKVPKVGKMKPLSQLFKQPEIMKETTDKAKNEISILWYFSTPKNQDGIVSRSECTPIIIKNDSVAGKGTKFYINFMRKEQVRF